MPAYKPIEMRFREKYREDEATGCWVWEGSMSRGYPYIRAERGSGCTGLRANRFAYEHFVGPIPDGMIVRHTCDNPRCVNPDHLKIGTHADNMRDMAKAGRRIGRNTGSAFDGKQIAKLKKLLAGGATQQEAADAIGVNRTTVQRAIYRGELTVDRSETSPRRRVYLTDDQRRAVLSRLQEGATVLSLAEEFGVDRKTIRNIRDRAA